MALPTDLSTVTLDQALAEVRATSGFDCVGSGGVALAQRYLVANRLLMSFYQAESATGSERVRQDENLRQCAAAITYAQKWLGANGGGASGSGGGGASAGGGGVVSYGFGGFGRGGFER